jgi:hypothetical protein
MTESTVGGAWAATHQAPREGLDAWTSPDPGAQPSSEVAGQVELAVVETAGAWARVLGQNGWEGWVDGRILERIDSSGNTGDRRAYILLGIAAMVLIVLAVLALTGS